MVQDCTSSKQRYSASDFHSGLPAHSFVDVSLLRRVCSHVEIAVPCVTLASVHILRDFYNDICKVVRTGPCCIAAANIELRMSRRPQLVTTYHVSNLGGAPERSAPIAWAWKSNTFQGVRLQV